MILRVSTSIIFLFCTLIQEIETCIYIYITMDVIRCCLGKENYLSHNSTLNCPPYLALLVQDTSLLLVLNFIQEQSVLVGPLFY